MGYSIYTNSRLELFFSFLHGVSFWLIAEVFVSGLPFSLSLSTTLLSPLFSPFLFCFCSCREHVLGRLSNGLETREADCAVCVVGRWGRRRGRRSFFPPGFWGRE